MTEQIPNKPEITNKDYHDDHCINCNQPIYETSILLEDKKQWVHVFTGCHYCDSIRPNKNKVAIPKQHEKQE